MRGKATGQEPQVLHRISGILIGTAAAFVVCILSLMLFSFGVSRGILAQEWMRSVTLCACLLGSGAGGWIAAHRQTDHGLLTGAAVGGGLFLMLLSIGWLLYRSISIENGGIFLLIGCLCGGALTGMLGSTKVKKKPAKGKRRKRR